MGRRRGTSLSRSPQIAGAIVAVEKEVCVNQRVIAACASAGQARQLAAMLAEVAAAPEADRGRLIGEHLDRWTDSAAAAERFSEWKIISDPLRTSGVTLFLLAFLVGPALYYSPWPPSWPVVTLYFVMLFAVWMSTVWDYAVCRQRLLGEKFSVRFRHVGMLLLSPASAMRSAEVLLRDVLAEYHPLAVAAALCRKDRCAALRGRCCSPWNIPRPVKFPATRRPAASTPGSARNSSSG